MYYLLILLAGQRFNEKLLNTEQTKNQLLLNLLIFSLTAAVKKVRSYDTMLKLAHDTLYKAARYV